jgi:hypothetical protein
MAADHALDAAALLHLLGKPADTVRPWLQRAATALALLFEAPAPEAIPVQAFRSDGGIQDAPGPRTDRSLANPRRVLSALQLGAIAGNDAALRRLAARVEAEFSGSDGAADPEQQLLLAVAALAPGDEASAAAHAAEARRSGITSLQADAVEALVERSPDRLQRTLTALIHEHMLRAAEPDMAREPLRAMSLAALAFAAFGRDRGLKWAEPPASKAFPLALLREPRGTT